MRLALCLALLLATTTAAETRTHEESGLRYELLRAPGWNQVDRLPLLVCLHGSGDELANFVRYLHACLPEVTRYHRVFVQSPDAGWGSARVPGIAAVTRAVREELKVGDVFAVGFSAGGGMTGVLLQREPALFTGGLIAGAFGPSFRPAADGPWAWWSLGSADEHLGEGGAQVHVERLQRLGWPAERYSVDVVEGLGHELGGASCLRGLRWLLERSASEAPRAEPLAAVGAVTSALEAGDLEALEDAGRRALATRHPEVRAALHDALAPALKDRRAPLRAAAIALLGRTGDPRAAAPLRGLLRKRTVRKDAELCAGVVVALGGLAGEAGAKQLAQLVKSTSLERELRLAAVGQLARQGDAGVEELLGLQAWAERKRDDELTAACDAALQALTGLDFAGSLEWKAYRKRFR